MLLRQFLLAVLFFFPTTVLAKSENVLAGKGPLVLINSFEIATIIYNKQSIDAEVTRRGKLACALVGKQYSHPTPHKLTKFEISDMIKNMSYAGNVIDTNKEGLTLVENYFPLTTFATNDAILDALRVGGKLLATSGGIVTLLFYALSDYTLVSIGAGITAISAGACFVGGLWRTNQIECARAQLLSDNYSSTIDENNTTYALPVIVDELYCE